MTDLIAVALRIAAAESQAARAEAERDALRADAGRWAPLLHAAGRVLQAVDDGYLQPDPETLQGSIAIDALREAWGTFAPARIKRGSND